MRVIIAGSRNIDNPLKAVEHCVECMEDSSGLKVTYVINGGARGIDQAAQEWSINKGIPHFTIMANWGKYGKSAGYRRNMKMAELADGLIAIWDGESKGTKHMIDIAKAKGLQVWVFQAI